MGAIFVYGIIIVMTADFEGQRIGEEVILVFRRHILTSVKGLGGGCASFGWSDVLAI